MTEHWDFDAEPAEDMSITFTMGGETFTTVPEMPAQAYKSLTGDLRGVDRATDFVRRVLVAEDRERWAALVDDDDRPIPAKKVGDLFERLTARYTKRPTTPPDA